jgi:hypothetical protein
MNERHSEHSTEKITLFTEEDARRLDARWEAIQSSFVEAPYDAMRSADELMLEMVSIINDALDRERRQLGSQWERRDGEVTTEVLRVTLQRYRELLDRLLHVSV